MERIVVVPMIITVGPLDTAEAARINVVRPTETRDLFERRHITADEEEVRPKEESFFRESIVALDAAIQVQQFIDERIEERLMSRGWRGPGMENVLILDADI
jgi:hypothetical protein